MTRVSIIGAQGFVGSAFLKYLSGQPGIEVVAVTRENYSELSGTHSDVTIEAACNSRKYVADENPILDFELSVAHRLRTLRDFPADLQVHLSSVDVYSDLTSPETTREDQVIDLKAVSNYGFHKFLAESLVQHYATNWLIIRLAGMVGPNLRKNPVFDILNNQPLRIHPDSMYQFIQTCDVARIVWGLVSRGVRNQVVNICGKGLISPREIALIAERSINLSALNVDARPRIVEANVERIESMTDLPKTRASFIAYLGEGGVLTSGTG